VPLVSLIHHPVLVFRDANDQPIPGARIFSYQAGTTTLSALYADAAGTVNLSNPAIADASGRLIAYMPLGIAFKLDVFDSLGVHVPGWPIDNIIIQNAITNPALLDDYSANVTQMRLTTDPGEIGSESLATSQAGEIERIRHVLKERGGTVSWYDTYVQRTATGTFSINSVDGTWPDNQDTFAFYRFHVPDGWQIGTNILLNLMRRSNSAAGTSRMTVLVLRCRDGAPITTLAAQDINFIPGDTNSHLIALVAAGGSLAVGDFINVQITRLGTLTAQDTNTGAVAPDGHFWQYSGIASR
jgi:hypothetical protein